MQAMKIGKGEELDTACGYISALALSAVAFGVVYNVFILVTASMESLTVVMSSLLPIMGSLFVMGGNGAAGAATTASLTLVLTIISLLCTKLLLPLLRTSFALCLVGALPSGRDLSSVTNFIKSLATTLLISLFTLLGIALYFQTSIAAAGDNYFSRSVRFASGVLIPIIGNMLGDAARTVMASVSLVKATVGAAGLVMILSVIIPPLITVVLNKLVLSVSSALAKAMGCEKEGALLFDLCGILNILLALVAGAGCVCIIALALFIKTGVTG
jgi:stage III sporulation protein AE